MKRVLKFVLPILILTAAIGVFAALKASKPEGAKPAIKERVWRVQVEAVEPATLAPGLTLYGRVESPSVYKAAAPAASRVQAVRVREGERVEAGRLLAVLDERDFLPRIEQSRAEVAELEAQAESERIRYEADLSALEQEQKLLALSRAAVSRAERLLKQKLGSDSSVDEAEQAVARQALALASRRQAIADHPARKQALEARLSKARSRLSEYERDYARSRIVAPYDAVVAAVNVAEGDQVPVNGVLLSLYALAELEVRARIPAPFQAEIQRAAAAGSELRGASGGVDGGIELVLARLAGEAGSTGVDGIFSVRAGGDWLRIGQVLRFSLRRPLREGVFPVPYQAVYGGDRVYVMEAGVLRGHPVEPVGEYAAADGERLLVKAPSVTAGDQLVLTHLPNAVEGLKIEAVSDR